MSAHIIGRFPISRAIAHTFETNSKYNDARPPSPRARSGSGIDAGIYSGQASDRTYARLAELARTIVAAGHPAIVDATFIERARREPFRELAAALNVPFVVLHCTAPRRILAQRIERRLACGADASEADLDVLRRQQQRKEAVAPAEGGELIDIDSDDPASVAAAVDRLARIARVDPS